MRTILAFLLFVFHFFGMVWSAWRAPDTPGWLKLLLPFAFIYAFWPRDFIPDIIPGVGLLDDLLVILLAVVLLLRLTSGDVRWNGTKEEKRPKVIDARYRRLGNDDPPEGNE